MKTIEEDIMVALKNIGAVNEEEFKRQRSIIGNVDMDLHSVRKFGID